MNKLLLKHYLKTGNSLKIKALSESEYEKLYLKSSFDDKVRLAHLRGNVIKDLDNFDLFINGRGLYELLDDKNNLIFYFELLDYVNTDILNNGNYIKRFNTSFWKNKIEESGFFSSSNDIYKLIERNSDLLIEYLENNKDFREMFFRNVSFEGNMYEVSINRILSNKKIGIYLAKQKEMFKFYNNKCFSMLYNLDESFFENLPDEYKFLIGYHSNLGNSSKEKIKNVLFSYFPFLSKEVILDILSLYDSNVSSDNIASLISFIIKDHDFYNKYKFLLDNYFDGDFDKTLFFCKKYINTKLFKEICFEYIPEIKEKIMFLSFSNRLKGIDSLDDIKNKSLEDLKNTDNDYSSYKDIKEDVRAFGKNDFICLNYEREIILIYPDGTIDEREVLESHDQILHEMIIDNGYDYKGIINFRGMVLTLANEGNTVLLIEGDNVVCTLPNNISTFQNDGLKDLFRKMNVKSQISLCIANDGELYALNNGNSMSSELASSELSRVKSI
ncbi:MAG: hypothetical protein IKF91_00300 [Bacilli bacterium]|nr:hypothetical protein [Bacilli bacterium]